MKKTALFLAILLVISVFAFASCDKLPWGNKECTDHVDADANYVCDNCGAEFEKPDEQPGACEHADENKDHKCDSCGEALSECVAADGSHNCSICGAALSECAAADGSHNCSICGAALSECAAAEGSHNCAICGAALSECVAAEGSHNCSICGVALSECADADGDYACDVCGAELLPENMERVSYYLNISDLATGTLAEDEINGKFNIVAGSEIRNRTKTFEGVEYSKSVKIGNSSTKIKVDVPGSGKLSFLVQNGSGSATTQFITVTAPDKTVYDIEFAGTNEGSPVVKIEIDVTEGEWIISRGKNGGTQDVFELSLSCIVEKSEENGFDLVSEGKVDYLVGQTLDLSGIRLNSVFANGKTEPLEIENVTVDTSLVNMGASGVYPVTISYKDYAPISVNINVYLPVSVELHYDAIEKVANSSAGNGVYYNHSFKEIYSVGATLDLTGLSVVVKGSLGEDSVKEFNIGNGYTLSEVDLSTAGEKILTVSYIFGSENVSANAIIYVVDIAPSIVEDVYQVKVDASYDGVIGAVEGGFNMFTTIQQALDFLKDSDVAKRKVIYIAAGYYEEKLEIEIPYLHIKGAGSDKVVIEWDSLYGLVDAGGFTHTTDSTQTVAVRENAHHVTIEGVTISNYWNTQERMDEAGLAIERGLALLVQADAFIMRDSALLGIQDTLELFTGRQYFENVFISGYTDFIFGTNNTTLFKNCTIHVIDTVKDNQGTAGYITAFKGSNKGAGDAIVYGAIFDGCSFTADEGVTPGRTAIGRTWGAYAAVAIINSEIGGHVSVAGYNPSNNKNTRYISMNGIHPTDATVQFVEYNNTGAGAITEAVDGMRFLSDEEAKLYVDYKVIFGTSNGNISYQDPWNPEIVEIVVDNRDYYYFNGKSSATGSSNTFDTSTTIASGSTLEWAGLIISAENGKVAWNQNANALNMKTGAFIKFNVKAGSMVTVETYPNYNYFTLNGVATASANMLSQYYADDTEVILLSTGDLYIYSITINPDAEAPAAPTLNEIKVEGLNLNYTVGDELALEGVVVKAFYTDNSVRFVTEYTVDASAVVNSAAGSYDVVFSYEGKSVTVTVTYEDPNAGPEISKSTVLDFSTPDGLAAVQNNPRVTIDGSVRHNGAEIQIKGTISFQVKAGTVVTVIPYANTSYASYTIGKEGETDLTVCNEMMSTMFFEDCTVVYTGLDNNYLVQIIIECPLAEGKYVFGGSAEEGDVTGILESIPGMSISGTCNTHSGGAQLAADSQIIFIAPPFATITIQGYDTNYGQLVVLSDGEPVEMNANAQYVINPLYPTTIIIEAKNVGTDDAPAYNKSYITYIQVDIPEFIEENTEISFGSAGNYKDSVIDFSGITIGDNGGNNSQVKNGSFSFAVKAGAKVIVHGYSGYTSYNFGDGDIVYEGITDEYFTYVAYNDCKITISHTTGNNYFYSFSVSYPAAKESVNITFGSEGNYKEGSDAVDLSGVQIGDNGGNNSQVKNGSITITLYAGATLTIKGYSGYTDYTLSDGTTEYVINKDSADHTAHSYVASEDVTVTITITSGNNYFYGIDIIY